MTSDTVIPGGFSNITCKFRKIGNVGNRPAPACGGHQTKRGIGRYGRQMLIARDFSDAYQSQANQFGGLIRWSGSAAIRGTADISDGMDVKHPLCPRTQQRLTSEPPLVYDIIIYIRKVPWDRA
jgi:hypothetical protein